MTKKNKKIQWDLLPGMFMMIFLPLVAKGQKVQVDLGKYSWFPDGDFQYDFFMYWKSIVFLILTAGMILVLIDRCVIRGFFCKTMEIFYAVVGACRPGDLVSCFICRQNIVLKRNVAAV